MVRIHTNLYGLKFSKDPFYKTMDAAILRLIRVAAREWLRAMIVRVPVWSGMARGSIKFASGPNGNLSRFLNVAIPIVPHPGARTKYKNAEAGAKYGHWNITSGNHNYRFFFRSDVLHYIHNEFFARTDPGAGGQQIVAPWHSLEVGAEAFNAAIEKGKSSLPRIQDAITKVKIGV